VGMGNSTTIMAGTKPGAESGQGDFFSPFSLLPPVASPHHPSSVARPSQHCGWWTAAWSVDANHSVTPLLQYSKWAMPFKAVPPAGGGFHVAKRHLMGFPVPRVAGTAFKSIALYSNTPFPTRFLATFAGTFLCIGWRQLVLLC
jgi:hypothetical protein